MTVLLTSVTSPAGPADADAERLLARARVFAIVRAAQLDGGLSEETVEEVIDEAELRGWPDVVKLGMFLGVVRGRWMEPGVVAAWTDRLLERARSDDDAVMTALALASRSIDIDVEGGRAPVDADRDLARAMVLLEGWSGPSREAVTAHIECALSCETRDLWELQLHHYAAAEACIDWDQGGEEKLPVLLYNRAELQVNWVAALRERGSADGLSDRARLAREALDAADVPLMPDSWREDLRAFRELVDAIAPAPGGERFPDREPEGDYAGYTHLARAFAIAPAPEAEVHVRRALQTIDQMHCQCIYLLALALVVELEAAGSRKATYGLRWGRELVARRWERRVAALASMQSLVDVERMAAEHALLQQHAYLDDLTGLANRRALVRFTDNLRSRGVRDVAVGLVDLDRFKSINDGHGHAVGDQVLTRVAALLRAGVREQDLVVRLGGDEFLLLLTLHDRAAARRRCEMIVEAVSNASWAEVCPSLGVDASVGVAFGSLDDFDDVCAEADAALYRAKQAGGARVDG